MANRTIPWMDDELCTVNGIKCCYNGKQWSNARIYLPGWEFYNRFRDGLSVNSLRRSGYTVIAPKLFRPPIGKGYR